MGRVITRARKLKGAVRDIFANSKFYRWTAIVSAGLVVLTTLLPFWKIIPNLHGADYIPLHYNIYFGVDKFGPWYYIFALPALGILMLLTNILFEAIYAKHEHVLSIFFAITTLLVETILLGSMVLITLINF